MDNTELKAVQNYEIIPVEEARRRGLSVPENPGTEVHLFTYRPEAAE